MDAGPEPRDVDRCLDRLGVRDVPLLVLTHFHADHVDGVAGVFEGRVVRAVETSRLLDPPGGVAEVDDASRAAGLVPAPATYGETRAVGAATVQVLWPPAGHTGARPRRRVDRQRGQRGAAGGGRGAPAAAHR